MDEERRRLRIELRADGELRALTPTQLLELLG
jgi:hypothetical protein